MSVSGAQQWFGETLGIIAAQSEFCELKTEQFEKSRHTRDDCERNNLNVVSRDDGGDNFFADGIIFDERYIFRETGLDIFNRFWRRGLGNIGFLMTCRNFTQSAKQFTFVSLSLFLQIFDAFTRTFLGA